MRKITLLILSCFLTCYANFVNANGLPPIFALTFYFGDSLSDNGNYVEQTATQPCFDVTAPVTNPVGGTAPGTPWNNMHFNQYFFNWHAFPSKLSGNDFAVAGATIIPPSAIPNDPNQPSNSQNSPGNFIFGTAPNNPNILMGEVGNYFRQNGTAYPADLYVFWGGANDIFDTIFFNSTNAPAVLQNIVIPNDFKTISAYISTMYNAGARNFLFIGMPDLSQTPLVAGPPGNPLAPLVGALNKPGLATQLFQLSLQWNQALQNLLSNAANNPNYPGIAIYFYNPQPLLDFVINHPVGVVDGIGYNFTTTNQAIWCNPVNPNGNGNPDSFIFFNYIHPTTKVDTIIAADVLRNSVQL